MRFAALLAVTFAFSACSTHPPPSLELKPCREMPRGWCSYTDALQTAAPAATGPTQHRQ